MDPDARTPLVTLLAGEIEAATAAYVSFRAEHPGHPDVAESRFNRLGYGLIRQQDLDGALAVFELNTVLYPESGNVFDSYGEALLEAGRRDEGIAAYRESLELDPDNSNAAGVLAETEGGAETR